MDEQRDVLERNKCLFDLRLWEVEPAPTVGRAGGALGVLLVSAVDLSKPVLFLQGEGLY